MAIDGALPARPGIPCRDRTQWRADAVIHSSGVGGADPEQGSVTPACSRTTRLDSPDRQRRCRLKREVTAQPSMACARGASGRLA